MKDEDEENTLNDEENKTTECNAEFEKLLTELYEILERLHDRKNKDGEDNDEDEETKESGGNEEKQSE